jgi:hypothetical protein
VRVSCVCHFSPLSLLLICTHPAVPQLYLTFPPPTPATLDPEPPLQLRGFHKLVLKPGESQEVRVDVSNQDAASVALDSETLARTYVTNAGHVCIATTRLGCVGSG